MMNGVPLETCWTFNKLWSNKFYYKAASCWYFYWIKTNLLGGGRGKAAGTWTLLVTHPLTKLGKRGVIRPLRHMPSWFIPLLPLFLGNHLLYSDLEDESCLFYSDWINSVLLLASLTVLFNVSFYSLCFKAPWQGIFCPRYIKVINWGMAKDLGYIRCISCLTLFEHASI
jgi:hypothetical protein